MRLAHHHMARRLGRSAALALCPRAGAHRADQGRRRTAGRDVADRVAAWRGRAHQVLAFECCQDDFIPGTGRHRQNALAHRARLPGPQARDRAWPLRRARLARFSPSRHAVYRGLWIPNLRAGDDSPLRTTFRRDVRETCHFRWLPTPRRRPSGPNGTSPTQSRPSIAHWWSQSPGCCRAAHAAPADFNETCDKIYDAVVLEPLRSRRNVERMAYVPPERSMPPPEAASSSPALRERRALIWGAA